MTYEFDDFPGHLGRVSIDPEQGVSINGKELIGASRDQWGVYFFVNGDGHRAGLYLRAAWQLLNGQSGTELEVCLEGIDKDENA